MFKVKQLKIQLQKQKFVLFFLLLLLSYNTIFSQQCPQSALKIESPICDTPQNLRVTITNCSTAKLSWKGNNKEQYVVEATNKDIDSNILLQVKAANYSCDKNSSCLAIIAVKENSKLVWNVQSICNINGTTIYSPKINAKATDVPYCQSISSDITADSLNTNFRVYPNPTTGNLYVEYISKVVGVMQLKVIDVNGKIVYKISVNARIGNNTYNVNLRNIASGTYILELGGNEDNQKANFVLMGR